MIAGSNKAAKNQSAGKSTSSGGKSKTTLKDSYNARNNIAVSLNSKEKME